MTSDTPINKILDVLIKVSNFKTLRNDLKIEVCEAIEEIRLNFQNSPPKIVQHERTYNQSTSKDKPSFSEVAGTTKKWKKSPESFNIIIKSNKTKDSEEIKRNFKSTIKPKDLKIGISKIASRKETILVETNSEAEREIILKKIEANKDLIATPTSRKKPRVILRDVDPDITMENIVDHLVSQNQALDISHETLRPVIFLQNKQNSRTHAVLETDAATRYKLVFNKVYLGYTKHQPEDYLRVRQCTNCCKFHHSKERCQGTTTCPKCSGNHQLKDCTEEQHKCPNCSAFNRHIRFVNRKIDTNHSALDKKCAMYMREINKLSQNTDYYHVTY